MRKHDTPAPRRRSAAVLSKARSKPRARPKAASTHGREVVAAACDVPLIRRALLRWYGQHRRDLPWRRSRDPYAIWVSEIMLQQTQVDTVLPRYALFLQQFPTVFALAAASEQTVCEAWAGLGYYRRARHLHAAAQELVERHGGKLPADAKALQQLPGIGRYTSGAIASIAFGRPEPLVDGNVERVLARMYRLDVPLHAGEGKQRVWSLAGVLVQGDAPGDFNQALMELGATVCSPQRPDCSSCPVRQWCGAYAGGEPTRYPLPAPRVVRQRLSMACVYAPEKGGLWLARRDMDGLWPGLWELPSASGNEATARLGARLGQTLDAPIVRVRCALTHRDVEADVYHLETARWPQDDALRLVADPLGAPLSALARKAIIAAQRHLQTAGAGRAR